MLNLFRHALLLLALVSAGAAMASDIHQELDDIAKSLATRIEKSQRTKVAVADFTDLEGTVRQFGRFVSEELSTNLVLAARGFTVIDRTHLRTILKEQKLSMSGLMDSENQKKLGKILGVDALVLGSINPFGENYRITVKVVATDTAEVVTADRGMVPKTAATDQLWDTLIRDEAETSVVTPPPTPSGIPQIAKPTSRPDARPPTGAEFTAGSISIKVDNVMRMEDKQYRVVGMATNDGDAKVEVMWLAPAQLLSELGNVANAQSSTGILPCYVFGGGWSKHGDSCDRGNNQDYTSLLPGMPQRFIMDFAVVGDQKTLGGKGQLTARLLVKGDKLQIHTINFPDLAFPNP